MVYCLLELFNYRQLTRLRASALAEIEAEIPGLLGARRRAGGREQGVYLSEMGDEAGLDAAACLSAALRALEYLRGRRDDLFGFNMLLARLPPSPAAGEQMRDLLASAEREEQLWVAPPCDALFSPWCSLEQAGGLYRLVALAERAPREDGQAPRPWVREALVGKVLDSLAGRLASGEGRGLLFVHGPPGAGKSSVLAEAARRLGGGADFPWLRLSTLFRRRSPLHPFLSGVLPRIVAEVPRFLRGPELDAWRDTGGLPAFLQGRGEQDLFPDRAVADFTIAFGLYALAWTRMARERLLPALMILDGVEAWHPAARAAAARLLEGLLCAAEFLPVVSSAEGGLPAEFQGFDVSRVHIHPLGRREIRSLAQHLFPGLEIPEAVARRLRRMSDGLPVSVASYLQYLLRTGRIRSGPAGHSWVQAGEEEDDALPADPLSVSWFLVRSLHDDAFLTLYAVHLAGGLLDREGLEAFLGEEGYDGESAGRSLEGLLSSGLLVEGERLIPRFPGLRRKLEELLGAQGERLRDALVAHMVRLWEAGRYPHHVLLFFFLAGTGRTDLALRVLPGIIRRRLDEGDAAGARAFCDPARLEFSRPPTAAEKKTLALVTTLGSLEAALLEGDGEEAARAAALLARETARGDVQVACAAADLSCGDAASALDRVKKALLAFQDSGDRRGERSAYLALGTTMLADGRSGEAVEYLGLAERLCLEGSDTLGALRAGAMLAACLFLEGRYSRSRAEAQAAAERARGLYQREAELAAQFLQARILFQLGSYEEAGALLQQCLAHAELYTIAPARPVLEAWLARAVLYQGDTERALACLQRMAPTREVLAFLCEAWLLAGGTEHAFACAEQGLALPDDGRFPPPLSTGWKDGSWCIEGRSFRLGRNDALLRRWLSALRAYLLARRGAPADAARELHGLTRGGKQADEDPSAYLLHYLYALVLEDSAPDQLDDKSTVLAKSLKGLQERASRIDTPSERSAFLTRSLWNRRIMDDARARKLV
jgi:tetratricopeptide (TPR) repeat protein